MVSQRAEKYAQIGWVSESMLLSESSWLWKANAQQGNSQAKVTASPSTGEPKCWDGVGWGPTLSENYYVGSGPPCPPEQRSCAPAARSHSPGVSAWAAPPVSTLDQPPIEIQVKVRTSGLSHILISKAKDAATMQWENILVSQGQPKFSLLSHNTHMLQKASYFPPLQHIKCQNSPFATTNTYTSHHTVKVPVCSRCEFHWQVQEVYFPHLD